MVRANAIRRLGLQFYKQGLAVAMSLLAAPHASAAPRAAQSVLLVYHAPPAVAVCSSVRIIKSQRGSYFQVCGFSHGYCGLQELADGQHIIIFSVWDPAPKAGRKTVAMADRVQVIYVAPKIHSSRFGGEGTGEHILVPYRWHVGQTYHLAIRSWAVKKRTAYAIWLYRASLRRWVHLATFSTLAEKPPGLISGEGTGYYAFIEDFHRNTISAGQVRQATFGPMWIKGIRSRWRVLSRATFASSDASYEARGHISALVDGDCIRLATGGLTRQNICVGAVLKLDRIPTRTPLILKRLPSGR